MPPAAVTHLQSNAVLDFSLLENKVLIAPGVQIKFQDIILANVK